MCCAIVLRTVSDPSRNFSMDDSDRGAIPLLVADDNSFAQPAEETPKDAGNVAYMIFFLMGAGTLLPWNVFINASAYFGVRFRGTAFAITFESWFGIAFNCTNILGLWLMTRHQDAVPPRMRVMLPFFLNGLVFLATTALVCTSPQSIAGDPLFVITILCCLASGACTALLQGGIFGLAAQFPGMYTQAVMGGQGLAGVAVSVASIATTAGTPKPPTCDGTALTCMDGTAATEGCMWDGAACSYEETYAHVKWSNFAYFLIASLFVLVCIWGYRTLERLPFALHYAPETLTPRTSRYRAAREEMLHDELKRNSFAMDGKAGPEGANAASLEQAGDHEPKSASAEDTAFVRAKIQHLALGVFNVFLVSLALFPAITANITATSSSSSRFFGDLFVPFSFLNFNLFDFVGRTLAGVNHTALSERGLVIASFSRWVFLPLFMLCHVDKSSIPTAFKSDFFPIVFMVLFACSNGYLSSCMMMRGPGLVPKEFQELAGTTMVFALSCGLGAGSIMSFAVHAFICQCNPFAG